MTDVLLDGSGDIFITEEGDIRITESIVQAARTRLLWLFGEWRFFPDAGFPYIEEVYVKNPDIAGIRRRINDEMQAIEDVTEVCDIKVAVNALLRTASITLKLITDEKTFMVEVINNVN